MTKAIAAVAALFAVAYLAIRPAPSRPPLPSAPRALAARVAAHPADWLAASALTRKALDAPVRDRLALWHATSALAMSLAPHRPEPRAALAESAFFHWTELSEADRKAVLGAYAPLLGDWGEFIRMHESIFELLGGDLTYLRRVRPKRAEAAIVLAQVALANGLFDDYRALRPELPPQGTHPMRNVDARDIAAPRAVAVTVAAEEQDEVPPYVEFYVDGALRAEGTVDKQQTFTVPVGSAGAHHLEVRLVNPVTRNRLRRDVRVVSVQSL